MIFQLRKRKSILKKHSPFLEGIVLGDVSKSKKKIPAQKLDFDQTKEFLIGQG